MTDAMPPDPFESGDFTLDLLGHGALIRDALREAADRGHLFEAVDALSPGDLRAVLIAWILGERFRASGDGGGEER